MNSSDSSSRSTRSVRRKATHALTALSLATLLTSCARQPVVNPVCPPVPGALTQPQPVPELVSNPAWRDVAIYAAQNNSALQACNADKQRIREWSKPDE